MQVIDTERSEKGEQRRRNNAGRLIHVCCICGHDDVWGDTWSYYGSIEDCDNGVPLPKFCSDRCRRKGGSAAHLVTDEMKAKARDAEWRAPKIVYRPATDTEKFRAALQRQRQR